MAWYGPKAWKSEGLPMSTTSNEACKMFDAVLAQLMAYYNDPNLGGVEGALKSLYEADPNCVLGHVLSTFFLASIMDRHHGADEKVQQAVDTMNRLAVTLPANDREKLHCKAVTALAQGNVETAAATWEVILLYYPTDLLAVKLNYLMYLFMGKAVEMRDSIARILPNWKPHMPNYGYLLGMHAFGLEEACSYRDGEKFARKALEINQTDGWAVHALTHVMEMEGRAKEGINFMKGSESHWKDRHGISCHNYWHWAVHHLEMGEKENALGIYDSFVGPMAKANGSQSTFPLHDASALLFRLEMEGVAVGDRWHDICEQWSPRVQDHQWGFNDTHMLLAFLGDSNVQLKDQFVDSMKDYLRQGQGTNHVSTSKVGWPLCQSLIAYNAGEYSKAVDLLFPVRYQVYEIGGSAAQRDLFAQFLIHAAMKSDKKDHNLLARHLLAERKSWKENSPLTDRLIQKAMAQHGAST